MSQHTPGPMPPSVQTIICPSCKTVVSYTSDYGTSTTCPLHAAAPELLAALVDAESALYCTRAYNLERWDGEAVRVAVDRARAVIAKAKGDR